MAAAGGSQREELNLAATKRAQEWLVSYFREPSQLEEIPALRAEHERRRRTAESSVRAALQAKQAGVRRAMDAADTVAGEVGALRDEFGALQQLCASTRTLLDAFPRLQEAHRARRNLGAALHQIEHYARVPVTVTELRAELAANPLALKRVYRRALELEIWRNTLEREVLAFRTPATLPSYLSSRARAQPRC